MVQLQEFKSNKWTWVGNFCRCVLSCVFWDQGSSGYGEEQHTAHVYRNPPELHNIISLELMIRHIPNILSTFKGLLSSGRTNSSSSLGQHWSFLEEDAQSNGTEKLLSFTRLDTFTQRDPTPKSQGQQSPSHSLPQCQQSTVKTRNRFSISKGRKKALTHQSIASNINQVFNCRKNSQCFFLPKCALYQFPFPKGYLLMKPLKWYF